VTIRNPTLSGLPLLAACPGSLSLPRQETSGGPAANLGTAIHAMLEDMVDGSFYRGGPYEPEKLAAMFHLPEDDAGRLAFLARNLRLDVPAGALAEVSLGLFPDGTVRRIEGGAGHYPDVGQILSGQIDCMWAEPDRLVAHMFSVGGHYSIREESTLFLTDWKTGDDSNIVPVERNWQLRAGALLAARWTGATKVIPAICYINAAECAVAVREGREYGGRWECGALLDAAALDAIEVELRALLRAARGESDEQPEHEESDSQADGRNGRELHRGNAGAHRAPFILGPHCDHCPSRVHCPAFAAEAVTLARLGGWWAPQPDGIALPDMARAYLAGILPAMRSTLGRIEAAIRAGGPVTLADGKVYGPVLETVTTYETGATFDALAEVIGEEAARKAFRTSAEALKRALGDADAPRGAFGRLRAEIEKRGGLVLTAREEWSRRYPALPVEVVSDEPRIGYEAKQGDANAGGDDDPHGARGVDEGTGGLARALPGDHLAADPTVDDGGPRDGNTPARAGGSVTARATCPTCGTSVAVNPSGSLRAHPAPGSSLRCRPVTS